MANPILAQTGGTSVALRIKYQSSCKNPIYNLCNPATPGTPVFSGEIKTPSLCGTAVIEIKDTAGLKAMTPTVKVCGPYVEWEVKDGMDNVVGYVETPNCAQCLQKQYCPWNQSVVLRATDIRHIDRFTIRAPGCCEDFCKPECCHTRCACVGAICACGKFDMTIPVYTDDMSKRDPVAHLVWKGTREPCPPFRVITGYTFEIKPVSTPTYNDTCLLVLLAIYLDLMLVAKKVPLCGE